MLSQYILIIHPTDFMRGSGQPLGTDAEVKYILANSFEHAELLAANIAINFDSLEYDVFEIPKAATWCGIDITPSFAHAASDREPAMTIESLFPMVSIDNLVEGCYIVKRASGRIDLAILEGVPNTDDLISDLLAEEGGGSEMLVSDLHDCRFFGPVPVDDFPYVDFDNIRSGYYIVKFPDGDVAITELRAISGTDDFVSDLLPVDIDDDNDDYICLSDLHDCKLYGPIQSHKGKV